MPKPKLSTKSAYGLLVTSAIIWGLAPLFYKQGLASTSLVVFLAGRFLLGAIVIYIFEKHRFSKIPKKMYLPLVLFALLDGVLVNLVYGFGVQKTSVTHFAVISLLIPLIVYYLASLLLKEKIHIKVVVGAVVTFTGLCVLIFSSNTSGSGSSLIGDLIIIAYSVLNALTIVIGRHLVSKRKYKIAPGQFAFINYAVSGVVLTVFSTISAKYITFDITLQSVWYIIIAGTLVGAIPIVVYYKAAKVLPAHRLADTFFMTPFVALLSGVIILGEQITTPIVTGACVVLIGLLISNNKVHPVLIAHRLYEEERILGTLFKKPKKAYSYVTSKVNIKKAN